VFQVTAKWKLFA